LFELAITLQITNDTLPGSAPGFPFPANRNSVIIGESGCTGT
jgi:hypothetical protein